jgi:hypothetical protein
VPLDAIARWGPTDAPPAADPGAPPCGTCGSGTVWMPYPGAQAQSVCCNPECVMAY